MKTTTKLAGLALVILLSFSVTLNAQRGMRGNGFQADSLRTPVMRSQMGCGRMAQGGNFNRQRQNYGMRTCIGIMQGQLAPGGKGIVNPDRNGWGPMGAGRLIAESAPNVTEKQKKDIADLRLKQQEEVKKLRAETSAKMQSMRDVHHKAILNILTDEQRKYLESKQLKAIEAPALTK